LIARVVLNSNTLSTDSLYDYLVPKSLEESVKVGVRVKVPFGNGNKTSEAFVLEICNDSNYENLKSVSDIISPVSYFNSEGANLIEFMKHRYFCSYMSAIRCLIPAGLNMKFISYYKLNETIPFEEIKKECKSSSVADKIVSCLNSYGTMSEESLKSELGKTTIKASLSRLVKKGYVCVDSKGSEKVSDTKKTFVELAIEREQAFSLIDSISSKAPARARVMEVLCDNYDIELSDLLVYAETSKQTVDALYERGYVRYKTVVCNDSMISYDPSYVKPAPVLNMAQKNAVEKISVGINSGKKSAYLIHGVTGSGKTEVYLSLIEKAINIGKDAILLVPEISLTPQMIAQIFGRFGDNVAVLHSKLTVKQRYNEWHKIKNGDVKIAVGARSAVFAPFSNIGLIIVDEEHETTYKSEMSPRYNAIEIARYIIGKNDGTLVLASATPSIDDYYKTMTGKFELVEMPDRANLSKLPRVVVADMRSELEAGNMSIFSTELKNAINNTLSKKEQIILFLNRRGFSGFVSCRECGYVMKCPRCNVSLTYHKSDNKMVCHYCDHKAPLTKACPSCGGRHIRFFGIGTEKIVDELYKLYPSAKVIRMDADTTSGRMAHENVLNHFKSGDADILVGTQMITKGLDFANVTLVGIVAADMSLNVDDYRAAERTFDLITQVVGRCGRAEKEGLAIVQTYNPDDETILLSAAQDYKSFYEEEISIRRMLLYPPFTEFIKIQFSGNNKNDTKAFADKFYSDVSELTMTHDFVGEIYNVSESPLFRLNGKYRYRFMLKTPYKKEFYSALHNIYNKYIKNRSEISISIDVNPVNSY